MLEKEENKNISFPELKIEGDGFAEDMIDSSGREDIGQDAISYGAGEKDPMDEFAEEINKAEAAPVIIDSDISIKDTIINESQVVDYTEDIPPYSEDIPPTINPEEAVELPTGEIINPETIIEVPEGELPELKESKKTQFNPNEVQSPLVSEEKEGGIVPSKSTGPTMTQRDPESKSFNPNPEGGQIKPAPDMDADSLENKFEVTGFTVEYEISKGQMTTVQIRDYFNDIETAFASVNGLKYLMPMPRSGYKVAIINSGAPTLCYNERQMYIYKNDQWKRM